MRPAASHPGHGPATGDLDALLLPHLAESREAPGPVGATPAPSAPMPGAPAGPAPVGPGHESAALTVTEGWAAAAPSVAVLLDGLDEGAGAVLRALVTRLREHGLAPVIHVGPPGDTRTWDPAALDRLLGGNLGPVLAPLTGSAARNGPAGFVALAGPSGRLPQSAPATWGDLPAVVIGARVPHISSVVGDPAAAMAVLVSHLVDDAGARRLAFIGGDPRGTEPENGSSVLFRVTCQRLGVLLEEQRIVGDHAGRLAGYRAGMRLLRRVPDVDSVVTSDDDTALGVLDALSELGVDVPGRVRVTGMGNDGRSSRSRPPLTTVDPGGADQGRLAADLLVARLNGDTVAREERIEPRLVVRSSTVPRPPVLRRVPDPAGRYGGQSDLLSDAETIVGPIPEIVDRSWGRRWLERLRDQMSDGRVDEYWVRSWSRPVGTVEDVERATEWLLAAARVVHDSVSESSSTGARSAATDVHGRVVARLARVAAERARAAERADVLAAQHALAVGRALDSATTSDEAIAALAAELPNLGVRRLAVVLPEPPTGGGARVALAYEDGRLLDSDEAANLPAAAMRPDSERQGPAVLRPLVADGEPLGLLVYEPGRPDSSGGGWTPDAIPDELAGRLARALARDIVRTRIGALRQGLAVASDRLEAETARRMAVEEELRRANRELTRSLTVDPMTGIHNRASLEEALEREWQAHGHSRRPLALLMVDVDHFKAYNDRYGHLQGDATLRTVAVRLRDAARRGGDVAARYGGEEFALVLPDTDLPGAERVADSLLDGIRTAGIPHADAPAGHLTVSVGVAVWSPAMEWTVADLVRAADEALYRAKAEGRDRRETASGSRPPAVSDHGLPSQVPPAPARRGIGHRM